MCLNNHQNAETAGSGASIGPRPLVATDAAWVPDYFGDDYLRLYQFPDERTVPEVAWLVRTLAARIPPDGVVLDLGCGQGRHAAPLATHGFRVIGLDYQANLLNAARARHQGLPLVRGDMRQIPFARGCDAILSLFTAFGYFDDTDNARVLREVATALRPDGSFILDVANPPVLIRATPPHAEKTLPDGTRVQSTWQWDATAGRYTHRQTLHAPTGACRTYVHSVRVYTLDELAHLFSAAGLSIESVEGGFCGEAYGADAPRLLIVARNTFETR